VSKMYISLKVCVVAFALFSSTTVSGKPEVSNSTAQILAKVLTAYGGSPNILAFIAAHKIFRGIRETENSRLKIVSEEQGEKQLNSFPDDPARLVIGFDGRKFWSSTLGFVRESSGTETIDSLCFQKTGLFVLLQKMIEKPESFRFTREESIFRGDKQHLCLLLTSEDGHQHATQIWIDPVSFFILRTCTRCEPTLSDGIVYVVNRDYYNFFPTGQSVYPRRELRTVNNKETTYDWASVEIQSKPMPPDFCNPAKSEPIATFTLPYVIKDHLMFVDGSVNGHTTKVLIDTGGNFSAVSQRFSQEADIRPLKRPPDITTTAFGTSESQPAGLSEMKLGHSLLGQIPLAIVKNAPYDCRLGTDVLRKFSIKMDCIGKKLIFSCTPISCLNTSTIKLDCPLDNLPHVEGEVSGKPYLFVIDTGYSGFATLETNEDFVTSDDRSVSIIDAGNRIVRGKKRLAKSFKLSSLNFKNKFVVETPAQVDFAGNCLGLEFLQSFSSVIFDFPRESLYLSRRPDRAPVKSDL